MTRELHPFRNILTYRIYVEVGDVIYNSTPDVEHNTQIYKKRRYSLLLSRASHRLKLLL